MQPAPPISQGTLPLQDPPPEEENPGEKPELEPEPDFDFTLYQPNELGEISIWMYHNIREPEAIWVRTPENFRADLQRFYDLGYRLVSLTDVVINKMIHWGQSPVDL
ncbi:MAG TPA: hypothetical protein DC024_03855 [Clostridiales bacterium]|nr:hypothetical protein [Clostridiales bacterium]